MIPCAWAFSKRRRIKDYVTIFTAIKAEAAALGLIIDPKELAAIKSFQFIYPKARRKVCSTIDSDEAENSSDSDEDIPSTEQQQLSTESIMTCNIRIVSGFAPSGIKMHKFYSI